MKRAIVYHAHGAESYARSAKRSARSAKSVMPDVDSVLITSCADPPRRFDRVIKVVDPGIVNAQFPPLSHLPKEYDSAIYLDCITMVVAPMYDVFELLEDPRTDIALTHTSGKLHDDQYPSPGVPKLWPHWRSAFIAFENSVKVQAFFGDWWKAFEWHRDEYTDIRAKGYGKCHPDQKALRIALYSSNLLITTLRSRFSCPASGVVVRGTVRTLTGNGDIAKRAAEVNKHAPKRRLFNDGKVTLI